MRRYRDRQDFAAAVEGFARSLQAWHDLNHPGRALSPFHFEAATGVVYEISTSRVAAGRAAELFDVEDDLVSAQLAILGGDVRLDLGN